MQAMQYSITLPRDYDMGIVRARVAQRGGAFDQTVHLGFKAFLIAEADMADGKENLYAPFYLWRSEQGMLDFLCGDKFLALTQSFGWPTVRTWIPLDFGLGNTMESPKSATRQIVSVSPHTDLTALRAAELSAQTEALRSPLVHSRVVALDFSAWQLVRFTLWQCDTREADYDPANTLRYEVLHLSFPALPDTNR